MNIIIMHSTHTSELVHCH